MGGKHGLAGRRKGEGLSSSIGTPPGTKSKWLIDFLASTPLYLCPMYKLGETDDMFGHYKCVISPLKIDIISLVQTQNSQELSPKF